VAQEKYKLLYHSRFIHFPKDVWQGINYSAMFTVILGLDKDPQLCKNSWGGAMTLSIMNLIGTFSINHSQDRVSDVLLLFWFSLFWMQCCGLIYSMWIEPLLWVILASCFTMEAFIIHRCSAHFNVFAYYNGPLK